MRRILIATLLAAAALFASAVATTHTNTTRGSGPIPWCPPVCDTGTK